MKFAIIDRLVCNNLAARGEGGGGGNLIFPVELKPVVVEFANGDAIANLLSRKRE